MKRILVVHPGGLGDVIIFLPALLALREHETAAQIDLLVEKRAYIGSDELLTPLGFGVKQFDFKGKLGPRSLVQLLDLIRGYETCIASGGGFLATLVLWFSGAKRRVGFKNTLAFLLTDPVPLNRKNRYAGEWLADLFAPLGVKPASLTRPEFRLALQTKTEEKYILIHPGVSAISVRKNILKSPQPAFWLELISALCLQYPEQKIILIAGPDDQKLKPESLIENNPNFLDWQGRKHNASDLLALIREACLFICPDSGPMHLALAAGTPTVALFAATDSAELLPPFASEYLRVVRIMEKLICQPCLWARRSTSCATPVCLSWLEPEAVIRAAQALLAKPAQG